MNYSAKGEQILFSLDDKPHHGPPADSLHRVPSMSRRLGPKRFRSLSAKMQSIVDSRVRENQKCHFPQGAVAELILQDADLGPQVMEACGKHPHVAKSCFELLLAELLAHRPDHWFAVHEWCTKHPLYMDRCDLWGTDYLRKLKKPKRSKAYPLIDYSFLRDP